MYANYIDDFISAEITNKDLNLEMYEVASEYMVLAGH